MRHTQVKVALSWLADQNIGRNPLAENQFQTHILRHLQLLCSPEIVIMYVHSKSK